MSKRRNNKNKKAGPVKIIRPADLAASAVDEAAGAPAVEQPEVMPSMLSTADNVDGSDAQMHEEQTHEEQASASAESESSEDAAPPEQPSDEPAESAEPMHEFEDASAHGEMPATEQDGAEPLREFEDASALLAQAIPTDPTDVRQRRQYESIPIVDPSATAFEAVDGERAEAESTQSSAAEPVEDSAVAGDRKGRKQDRKLKLNKLQKHARSTPEPEPEPETAAPEPEPARRVPSEPRIAAFAKLSEYQSLSLAHVPGLPEEADVPGHWRGVGFGISGRRLVAGFDEVVEIIRVPQVTHVPGTQPWMLGVANVRGTLLPVVDLKQFLEGERTVMHEGQRVLVVRQAGGNVAVLIDQLFGQRTFNDTQKVASEVDSSTRYGHFVRQVYRVGDNDWGVFSMSMLTRTPEFRQAAA